MITTVDGIKCKKGEKVWEIGVLFNNGIGTYKPTLSVYLGSKNRLANEDKCWKSYSECIKECAKMNNENIQLV